MTQHALPQTPSTGVDRTTLRHILSMGGDALRTVLIAQLRADLLRLRSALEQDDPAALHRAAHELKGLSATVGARDLADLAARFDLLADGLSSKARGAMALGLRVQIDGVIEVLETEVAGATTP
jgi:HPt (histidine-containing phosphotransfer) domain-containing protein